MKSGILFLVICVLALLSSCQQAAPTEDIYSFEQDKQNFQIIHTTALFKNYIEQAQENPSEASSDLYQETVIQPIYDECFKKGEYIYMADATLYDAPTRLTELKIINDFLATNQTQLNEEIQEALEKSAALLPTEKDVAVCIFPSIDTNASPYTVGAGKIIIPYNDLLIDADFLKTTIAHEYHHSMYAEKGLHYDTNTVLDNLIFEGKAVMFEKMVYPTLESTPVDPTYDKNFWAEIEKDLDTINSTRSLEILRGGNELPFLYGYSEGYKMIESYLANAPSTSIEKWTSLSTQEIIDKGNYFSHYDE